VFVCNFVLMYVKEMMLHFAVGCSCSCISSLLTATSKLPRVIDWKLFGKRAHEPYWCIEL